MLLVVNRITKNGKKIVLLLVFSCYYAFQYLLHCKEYKVGNVQQMPPLNSESECSESVKKPSPMNKYFMGNKETSKILLLNPCREQPSNVNIDPHTKNGSRIIYLSCRLLGEIYMSSCQPHPTS